MTDTRGKRKQIADLLSDMQDAMEIPPVDWSQVAKMMDELQPLIEYMYEEWLEENYE